MLLAGPSGSGKTHLAARSGLPILDLDDFYKDGSDPSLPRHPTLGIVDWDDPASWDAEAALAAIATLCRDGRVDVPIYDIARDGRVGTRSFDLGEARAFVGTGIFAAELVTAVRGAGCWRTRWWCAGRGTRTSSGGCAATWPSTGNRPGPWCGAGSRSCAPSRLSWLDRSRWAARPCNREHTLAALQAAGGR